MGWSLTEVCYFHSDTFEAEFVSSRATGKQALCMEQYDRLLNAYRKPGPGKDELVTTNPRLVKDNEHAIVMSKGYVS